MDNNTALTRVEDRLNHVLEGAYQGEPLKLINGTYYIGDIPFSEETYERIEIADPEVIRKQKEQKKKKIGKEALGMFAAPVLIPQLVKDLDGYLKAGSLVNIYWKTGEKSLVFLDRNISAALLNQGKGIIGTVKDIANAFVAKKRTPITLGDVRDRSDLPYVLKIVDDVLYKDNPDLKGAVGWRELVNGQQVLYLFDEVVKDSGLKLKPHMECDAIYCAHPYDRKTYLMIDSMLIIAQQERLAELKQIAYDLGAVKYSVDIDAERRIEDHIEAKKKTSGKFKVVEAEDETSVKIDSIQRKKYNLKSETIHGGPREPKEPKLVWFANNDDIRNLINNRLNEAHPTSSEETVRISGSTCAVIGLNAAGKLGATVKKIGASSDFSLKKKVEEENHQILEYHLVF